MRIEHHLVGGYVRYISPHIIIYYYIINNVFRLIAFIPTRNFCLQMTEIIFGNYFC